LDEIGVGVIGSGNISSIYLTNLPHAPGVKVRGIADVRAEAAEAQGKRFSVAAMSVDDLLKRDDIQIVVNLTVPAAHATVSIAALSAGKHVFSEKPLAIDVELGRKVMAEAEWRGLLVGCAPDTFLGAGGRLTRKLIDAGPVGRILSGTAFLMSHGMEHWHPDPEFFFKRGGGPVLDVGVYYITALVNLLGPIARVHSLTSTGFEERIVTSQGPRTGYRIKVETPTTALSMLEFASGAQMMFVATWDVWKHSHPPIELYGTEGSLRVPDPNFYGGVVETTKLGGDWIQHSSEKMPLGRPNWPADAPRMANYRALGVADMVRAIRSGKKHHASGALALHVLEVMEAVVSGGSKEITAEARRPEVFAEDDAATVFDATVVKPNPTSAWAPAPKKKAAAKKPGKRPAAKKLGATAKKAKKNASKKAKRPAAKKKSARKKRGR
jgi:predicted dehydrogenase